MAPEPAALDAGADDGIRVIGLGLSGRRDEARRRLIDMRQSSRIPLFQAWIEYLKAWLDRRTADMTYRISGRETLKIYDDPEATFLEERPLCDVGNHETGLDFSARWRRATSSHRRSKPVPVRRAADRFRFPRAAGGSGSGPPASARRVSRGRWRATDRPVTGDGAARRGAALALISAPRNRHRGSRGFRLIGRGRGAYGHDRRIRR